MPLYLKFFPASGAPSMLTRMPLAEFAMRSQRASPLPPLFYAWPQRQAQHQQSRRDQQGPDREEEQRQGCEGLPQHSTQAPSGIGEYYYMQTPLTKMLAQDCDLSALPFKLIQGSGHPHSQRAYRRFTGCTGQPPACASAAHVPCCQHDATVCPSASRLSQTHSFYQSQGLSCKCYSKKQRADWLRPW